MNEVVASDAPAPGGHYAQAIEHGGLVYVSGQLPITPGVPPSADGLTIEAQTERCLENVRAVLRAAGCDLHDVLRATVYIADASLWPRVDATYARVFGAHRPARSIVPCGTLHHGFSVEIDVVARAGSR